MKFKIMLIFAAISLVFIAGCGNNPQVCSEGANCRYYTGTRGVQMYLENAPHTLFYYSGDMSDRDLNSIDLNVRLRNEGASESIGGTFLAIGPSFSVFASKGGEPERLMDGGRFGSGCGFSVYGFSSGGFPYFNVNCLDGSIGHGPGGLIDFTLTSNLINNIFNTNLPEGIRLDFLYDHETGAFRTRMDGFATNIDYLLHGKVLIGIVHRIFQFEQYNGIQYTLRGDNPEYPGGQEEYITYRIRRDGAWPAGTDQFDVSYQVRNCYAYTTFVSPTVCIDPAPFLDENKVCRSTQTVNLGSQGAPVAITQMEQINTGRSIEIRFNVQNMGGGTVWDVGSLDRCSPFYPDSRTLANFRNIVYVGFVTVDNVPIRCTSRIIRLNQGRGQFTCSYDLSNAQQLNTGYEASLRMELWYGYEQTITRNLRVRRMR